MIPDLNTSVAETLGAEAGLLPFLAELLADLDALGTSPEDIVSLVQPLALPPNHTRVLDLGCGKGAAAIALARGLQFSVRGYDGYPAFVEAARRAAEAAGVSERCTFACADLRDAVHHERDFDLVIYLAVGSVLGPLDRQIAKLRETVRPGGYMLLDDCYRTTDDPMTLPEYDALHTHDEALAALTRHGDKLLVEERYPVEAVRAMNARNNAFIRARVRDLSARYPEFAHAFTAYLERQEEECEILETKVADVHWLLQRQD